MREGYTSLYGSTSTQLAELLKPPIKPSIKTFGGYGLTCLGFLVLVVIWWIALTIFRAIPEAAWVGTAIWFLLIFLFFRPAIKKENEKFDAKNAQENTELITRREAAIKIYERSYYCFRDDQVFDPETGNHCVPQDLTTLLAENLP